MYHEPKAAGASQALAAKGTLKRSMRSCHPVASSLNADVYWSKTTQPYYRASPSP